jgi:hypothetical protein
LEEEIKICRQLLAVVCKADQQSSLVASNARAHSLTVSGVSQWTLVLGIYWNFMFKNLLRILKL